MFSMMFEEENCINDAPNADIFHPYLPGEGRDTLVMLWLVPQGNNSEVCGESSPPS